MQYISSRGEAPSLDFGDVLLEGLAIDGGLYLPNHWPSITTDDITKSSDSSLAYVGYICSLTLYSDGNHYISS